MVKFIESELVLLKKEIDEMWTLVYNQLDRAGEAVLTFDRELAQQVLVRERRVNALELKIDSDVEDIIALYNPVAIDLRFVLAMLKINTNLERLGDFAEGIARFVLNCKERAAKIFWVMVIPIFGSLLVFSCVQHIIPGCAMNVKCATIKAQYDFEEGGVA